MPDSAYLKLQPSEASVLAAASRIFSAYVVSGEARDVDDARLVTKAVDLAVKMAMRVDALVKSDDELDGEGGSTGFPKLQQPQVFPSPGG